MKTLCEIIKNQVVPNFINLETAIKTYDRNALAGGGQTNFSTSRENNFYPLTSNF